MTRVGTSMAARTASPSTAAGEDEDDGADQRDAGAIEHQAGPAAERHAEVDAGEDEDDQRRHAALGRKAAGGSD